MKVLFFIQRSKINKRGLVPIMCRITYQRQRKEFTTGMMIKPGDWDSQHKKVNESSINFLLNTELELITQKLRKAYLTLQLREVPYSIEDILKLYRGEHSNIELGVMEAYAEHNAYNKKLIGKDLKIVSWQKFENTKVHVGGFIKWKYRKNDLPLAKLKFQFITDFEYYLKTQLNMQQSTINKTLQRFKKMIAFAVAQDYIDKSPFLMHKPKSVKKEVVYLTKEELDGLRTKLIENERLEAVRDCFVFCCYTGLAFREMASLQAEHVVKNRNGKNWLRMKRQKTGKTVSVPLLPQAQDILDKYEGIAQDKLLPVKTNAHFNAYLKEIAGLCNIKINLTHHIARKTFATTVLLHNDVPIEIVSKLLGHSRIGITQAHYGQILEDKVGEHMENLSRKIN